MHEGNDHTLLLDIDGMRGFNTFLERLWILKYLGIKAKDAQVFKTTNGRHAILYCDNQIPDIERVLVEVLLSDDYKRGLCNYLKVKQGTQKWDWLFEEKSKTNAIGEQFVVSHEEPDPESTRRLMEAIRLGE